MGLYDNPVPATFCGGRAGSTMGGDAEEDPMASSLS